MHLVTNCNKLPFPLRKDFPQHIAATTVRSPGDGVISMVFSVVFLYRWQIAYKSQKEIHVLVSSDQSTSF